jgi:hypothetical protein
MSNVIEKIDATIKTLSIKSSSVAKKSEIQDLAFIGAR